MSYYREGEAQNVTRAAGRSAAIERLRPAVSDHEVHAVTGVLLDFRHSPMGEIEMARIIIDRLDDLRFNGPSTTQREG